MEDCYFYSDVVKNEKNSDFLDAIQRYSEEQSKQVYIINKPLGENKYKYNYKDAIVLLIPKYRIIFVDFGNDKDKFEDYIEDFIEDLGYISDKYDYKKILGRPRKWKEHYFEQVQYNEFDISNIDTFLKTFKLNKKEEERNGEFLISLLTGSINKVDRVGVNYPENILEQIKRKIILFDADQTRFIYKNLKKKRITIQGLAGTGKTELLLHKLKDLYTKDENSKIVFTCHNKILAENLKERIPEFFNYMKVSEQIKWNDRLWTVNGWGSSSDKNSGLYAYVCKHYNIAFRRYSYSTTFNIVCKDALAQLKRIDNFTPCFDYILIDESQDFPESFFKLCEKVTKKNIYVAGDIFQNVFDEEIVSKVSPDYLLNRCYRTDSKTLMFAHAIGMGLFEKKLRWLNDDEWGACGYIVKKKSGNYILSRKPLRRFEDLSNSSLQSIKLIEAKNSEYATKVISILESIVDNNPTVKPDDIGIIFLENINSNYQLANELEVMISQKFGWNVDIGYETKNKIKDSIFISNRNNVKGLEFPFVICIAQSLINRDLQRRNSIYMMLTRSFLTSYFIVSRNNGELIDTWKKGIETINKTGTLIVSEPDDNEKEMLRNAIISKNKVNQSSFDFIEGIMDEMQIDKDKREKLHKMLEAIITEGTEEEKIRDLIRVNSTLI